MQPSRSISIRMLIVHNDVTTSWEPLVFMSRTKKHINMQREFGSKREGGGGGGGEEAL